MVINLRGTVVENEVTPICLELRGYFDKLLEAKTKKTKSTDKRKVKPSFYGSKGDHYL